MLTIAKIVTIFSTAEKNMQWKNWEAMFTSLKKWCFFSSYQRDFLIFCNTTEPGLVVRFIKAPNWMFNEIKGIYQTTASSSRLFFFKPCQYKMCIIFLNQIFTYNVSTGLQSKTSYRIPKTVVNRFYFLTKCCLTSIDKQNPRGLLDFVKNHFLLNTTPQNK